MPGGAFSLGSPAALNTVSIPNPMKWGTKEDQVRAGTPERMVATWVDTVLQRPGEPAQRGFGGRLYFYDKQAEPIIVEGRLVVYAFDESDRDPTDHEPTRRYIFPPEQIVLHQSESDIGQSYSFWLPWDEVGGISTEVTLISRFEPVGGTGMIVSESARQRLPGRMISPSSETLYAEKATKSGVQRASFSEAEPKGKETEPVEVEKVVRKRLSTTTIDLRK